MKSNKIQRLSDREHVLKRTEMYANSTQEIEEERTIIDESGIHFNKKIKYVPALIKIIEEILDNSVDEALRTNFKFSNKIKIKMLEDYIVVEDNGRGIPIEKDENGEYLPFVAWNYLRAGSNFNDKRITLGAHGIGASLSNILSKKFKGETWNNNKYYTCTWKNNAETFKETIKELENNKNGTRVILYPDFSRFENRDKFKEIDYMLVKSRLYKLSLIYPEISFYFNGKKVIQKDLKNLFFVFEGNIKKKNYEISLGLSSDNEFEELSIINGLDIKTGTHTNYVLNKIMPILKEKINKKLKIDVKLNDIKNILRVAIYVRNFLDLKFTSQTKEYISNSAKDLSKIFNNVKWEKLANKIFTNDEFIEKIKIKEENKISKINNTKRKTIIDENYVPSIKEKKYLFLTEGLSAMNGLRNIFGRNMFGYLAMSGVPMNIWEKSLSKISETSKFKLISKLCGINYVKKIAEPLYENIVIATDMDVFGIHIRGLLLAYFYKFGINLLENKKLFILKTPLVFIFDKKNNFINFFFSLNDLKKFEKENGENFNYKYAKGLGSLDVKIMKELFKERGIDYFLDEIIIDESLENKLDIWFSNNKINERKEIVKQYQFEINMM